MSASQGLKEVSCVAIYNGDSILWGKRKDNFLWSLPGGHLNQNESPVAAAIRETMEETGIRLDSKIVYLGHKIVSDNKNNQNIMVHAFKYDIGERPEFLREMQLGLDPDDEFSELKFVDLKSYEYKEIEKYAHCPRNVVLELMGLQ